MIAVAFVALKIIQRRRNMTHAAALDVLFPNVNCTGEWCDFVSKLDVDARLFACASWDAHVRQACGGIVHMELNPLLDRTSPVVANFRSGINECSRDRGVFLWHGTSEANVLPICSGGFNPGNRGRQVHGEGEYFGRTPATSHAYTSDDGHGMRRLILCYVLKQTAVVGDIVVVNNPPLSQEKTYVLPVLVVTYSPNALNPPLNCLYTSPFGSHRIMYHQTSEASASAIMLQGFDIGMADNGIAGTGIYFATHPQSTFHKARAGRGRIMRVTLNVGRSLPTDVNPGAISAQTLADGGYSSVRIPRNDWNRNATENGAEYVVYHACQALPHTILPQQQYDQCRALSCSQ